MIDDLTDEVVRLAMAVDPNGFIGVRVKDLAELWTLRGEGWLDSAAKELAEEMVLSMGKTGTRYDGMRKNIAVYLLAILRRHRDGTA